MMAVSAIGSIAERTNSLQAGGEGTGNKEQDFRPLLNCNAINLHTRSIHIRSVTLLQLADMTLGTIYAFNG